MSRRVHTVKDAGEFISEAQAHVLLDTLCVKYGFSLPPLWWARLKKNPPRSVDRFTDTVFRAEGLDPMTADSDLYKAVRDAVRAAFAASRPHDV